MQRLAQQLETMMESRTAESYAEEAAELRRNLRDARAERDVLRRDAERYRWLRNHGDSLCTEKDGYGGQTLKIGDRLDSALDAAMSHVQAVGAA